ncbi:MAG: hypothetical protein AB1515_05850, partial [Nitrospirota bacterium]
RDTRAAKHRKRRQARAGEPASGRLTPPCYNALAMAMSEKQKDLDDDLLEHSPAFLNFLEAARREYLKKGAISPERYVVARKRRA